MLQTCDVLQLLQTFTYQSTKLLDNWASDLFVFLDGIFHQSYLIVKQTHLLLVQSLELRLMAAHFFKLLHMQLLLRFKTF